MGGHFLPLEATKREKPYCGDPKILSFSVLRPPKAKNDLFTSKTKKIFSKLFFFFVFSDGGHFWPLEARNVKKLIAWTLSGPENPFFCHFLAIRGQIWPLNKKYKKKYFKNQGFLCFMKRGPSWPLKATKRKKKLIPGTQKSFLFLFSGLQRPKMTFLHKIQQNLFQIGFFLVFSYGGHFWPL